MDDFIKWLLELVLVGGSSAAIAFGLFKWLGQRWIEHQLNMRLEGYKAEQQKALDAIKAEQQRDLERLRQVLSGRIGRIYEKEFNILPKAWFKLHDAYGAVFYALIGPKFYPDLANLTSAEIEEVLTERPLTERQKQNVRAAVDKQTVFKDVLLVMELNDAQQKRDIFHNYLIKHRIFMTPELREKFGVVDTDLHSALIEYVLGKQGKDVKMQISGQKKVSELADKINAVEDAVKERLHHKEA